MKHFKLTAWPDLQPPYHRTAYRRMLSDMSHRFVSFQQLVSAQRAEARIEVRQFVEMLDGRGLLGERAVHRRPIRSSIAAAARRLARQRPHRRDRRQPPALIRCRLRRKPASAGFSFVCRRDGASCCIAHGMSSAPASPCASSSSRPTRWRPILPTSTPWCEAERSRSLRIGLLESGYNIVAVLPADMFLPDRLAQIQPDMIIVDAESEARDTLEHVVMRHARRAPADRAVHRRRRHHATCATRSPPA